MMLHVYKVRLTGPKEQYNATKRHDNEKDSHWFSSSNEFDIF